MAIPSTPLVGNPTRVTADVAIKASAGKIWAVQLDGGTDASSLVFHNHASSATGDPLYSVKAPCVTATASEAGSVFVDLTPLGGIAFSTGIYCNWTGTAAVGYVWFS